jgi:DNA-binding FrmR family transcriptional regulator
MVEEDRDRIEILTQITAAHAALDGVALAILERRLRAGADKDAAGDEQEAFAHEVTAAVARLIGR